MLLLAPRPSFGRQPHIPAGYYVSDQVVNTFSGPLHNAIAYAPKPQVPPHLQRLSGRGVYVIDIGIVSGTVYDVRVLKTSGNTALDEITRDALRKWRFRPRSIHKLTIPIDFGVAAPRR